MLTLERSVLFQLRVLKVYYRFIELLIFILNVAKHLACDSAELDLNDMKLCVTNKVMSLEC